MAMQQQQQYVCWSLAVRASLLLELCRAAVETAGVSEGCYMGASPAPLKQLLIRRVWSVLFV